MSIRRSVRGRMLGVLLVALAAVTGCSGIPSSGSVQTVTKMADQRGQSGISLPTPDAPPDGIVRGFISASGLRAINGTAGSYLSSAAQYLTVDAQKTWPAAKAQTVVLDNDIRVDWDPDKPTEVSLSGTVIGVLDSGGAFREGGGALYSKKLRMEQVNKQWRIADPPDDLIVQVHDFQQNYVQRTLFFLDATGTVVVPDLRYLDSAPDGLPGKLLDLLIGGPAGVLGAVARNELTGAQLRTSVHADPAGVTVVDITGVALPTPASRRALAAQVVYTLTKYSDADTIAIMVGGALLEPATPTYTSSSLQSFDPDRTPAIGTVSSDPYYVDTSGRIVGLTDGAAVPGSLGNGLLSVRSAAISAVTGEVAATTRIPDTGISGVTSAAGGSAADSEQLVLGQPTRSGDAQPVLTASELTAPSFSRTGDEVWVVRNGSAVKPEIYQISASGTTTERPSRLQIGSTVLTGKGAVTALQISPDGVRVALVAGGKLYMCAVSYTDKGDNTGEITPPTAKSTAELTNLTQVGLNLSSVSTVTFNTSTELMVAAKTGIGYVAVSRILVDGSDQRAVTTKGLTGDVDSIAISPSGPDSGMYLGWNRRVYALQGTVSDGSWVTPPITTASVLGGTNPFYPS